MAKTGYLLINLGTPQSASTADVRRYLGQFLMDPYVIDLPWPLRRILVSLLILPFRPKKSAHAYASIWTPEGSPLLLQSEALTAALSAKNFGPVELAMRYGTPTIEAALHRLEAQNVDEIVVAPLYPQFADSTVTTSLEQVQALSTATPVRVLAPFYERPEFIQPLAKIVGEILDPVSEHLLLSFHGLPERHLTRTDPTQKHCLTTANCCDTPSVSHATCYRHQVYATSQALATALGLTADQYTVSFQSRLGRLPWLQPYTDQVLAQLPAQGIKNLVVACPAFVADNLETLEEMGIQGRETFIAAGGESFKLAPCLNDDPHWVEGLKQLLEHQTVGANSLT